MKHALAAIGICAWNHLLVTLRCPAPGAGVDHEFEEAGGTTANTCAALGLLGLRPMLASRVGDDDRAAAIIESLARAGCDVHALSRKPGMPTERSIVVVPGCGDAVERTRYRIRGARPVSGERLPVDEILDHRWVLLDVDDPDLRAFWLDLPAHRSPRTRLIGTMTYLVEMAPNDAWRQALHHDVLIGSRRELLTLTGTGNLDAAIARVQSDLRASTCNVLYVSLGPRGAVAIRSDSVTAVSAFDVDLVDTTGAGDAFAAGCIWGLIEHLEDRDVLRRGNLLGGLACTALGARAGVPNRDQALEALDSLQVRAHDG